MNWIEFENAKGQQAFKAESDGWKYAIYRDDAYGWTVARLEHESMDGEVLCSSTPFIERAQEIAEWAEAARKKKEEQDEKETNFAQAVTYTEDAMDDGYQTFKAAPTAENYQSLLGDLAEFQAAYLAYQKEVKE